MWDVVAVAVGGLIAVVGSGEAYGGDCKAGIGVSCHDLEYLYFNVSFESPLSYYLWISIINVCIVVSSDHITVY